MKTFILAIALLFSSSLFAHDRVIETPEEIARFIEQNVVEATTMSPIPYIQYLGSNFNNASVIPKLTIAAQYAVCYVIWNDIHANGYTTETTPTGLYETMAWRAKENARLFIERVGRDPNTVEEFMIPMIQNENVTAGTGAIIQCTLLDIAGAYQREVLGLSKVPPKDYEPEKLPQTPKAPTRPGDTYSS